MSLWRFIPARWATRVSPPPQIRVWLEPLHLAKPPYCQLRDASWPLMKGSYSTVRVAAVVVFKNVCLYNTWWCSQCFFCQNGGPCWYASDPREIGNLLPNHRRQRRTCYALCHILYPVSAAHTSTSRMDSNSTSYPRPSILNTQHLTLNHKPYFQNPEP